MVNQLKVVKRTNNELTTEIAALTSRVQVLERDLAAGERRLSAMRTSYTCHVQRLTAMNKELEKDLEKDPENCLREAKKAQRSLRCPICTL